MGDDVTMPVEPSLQHLRDVAEGIVTDDEARDLFAAAGEESPTADALKGFRYSFAESAARTAYLAGKRAGRRGRGATPDDVAAVAERPAGGDGRPRGQPGVPERPVPPVDPPFEPPESVRSAAADAITGADAENLLVAATVTDPERKAVDAFRSSLVETAVELLTRTVGRARRRGRAPTGDDVGDAVETILSALREL